MHVHTQSNNSVTHRPRRRWLRLAGFALKAVTRATSPRLHRNLRLQSLQRSRTLKLAGLSHPVHVYRDARGIAHIEARTQQDVYLAQGFVTAQDRLWQMDMSRRLVSGRLAEVLGAGLLGNDKLFRAYSLRAAAEESLPVYPEATKKCLASYCQGVNAYLEQAAASGRLPVEFQLLGYVPEPWTMIDILSVGKLLQYSMSHNLGNEAFRYLLQQQVGADLFQQIVPMTSSITTLTIPDREWTGVRSSAAVAGEQHETQGLGGEGEGLRMDKVLDLLGNLVETSKGSNGWVVGGSRTESGKPLFANDPHIDMQTPSTWYQTHLVVTDEQERMNVIGVAMPGVCGIILGRNDKIAWGVTNNRSDAQDLYIEKRNPDNPTQFAFEGRWEDAKVRRELIAVKGQQDVEWDVVVTRHGPILSDVYGGLSTGGNSTEALALQWTAHLPSTEVDAVLQMNRATDWDSFREALRDYRSPVLNFLFAAADGTIAYRMGGVVPIRANGQGLMPTPGWDGQHEWTGFIPFDEMPELVNPEQGYLLSANNQVITSEYAYHLTDSWDAPYRAQRINELLKDATNLTLQDMVDMQGDLRNLQAQRLLPLLLPVLRTADLNDRERECLRLLEQWDCVDDREQGAPLIYHAWWWQMSRQLLALKMGDDLFLRMVDRVNVTDELLVQAADGVENDWVREAGGLSSIVCSAFRHAVEQAVQLQGENPAAWNWGDFHRYDPQHPIGKQVEPLGKWINPERDQRISGSNVTIRLASFNRTTGALLDSAPWRMVVDLATHTGLDLNAPGQSGDFLSPWYEDQCAAFIANEPQKQLLFPEQYQALKSKTTLHS